MAIKAAGVSCVVAASFARIFYRNAFNTGLPIVVCPEAAREAEAGDRLRVDVVAGRVDNLTKGATYAADAYPPFMRAARRERRSAALRATAPERRGTRVNSRRRQAIERGTEGTRRH